MCLFWLILMVRLKGCLVFLLMGLLLSLKVIFWIVMFVSRILNFCLFFRCCLCGGMILSRDRCCWVVMILVCGCGLLIRLVVVGCFGDLVLGSVVCWVVWFMGGGELVFLRVVFGVFVISDLVLEFVVVVF